MSAPKDTLSPAAKNEIVSLVKLLAILVSFWVTITSSLATKESVDNIKAQISRIESRVDVLYNERNN